MAACVVLVALSFNSRSGEIAPDTKFDLAANPWHFLGRALHMWDGQGFAGQVQNQAYGYLFPMGPFFGVGHWMHLPAWAIQRLWWGALLCVAFLGTVALARKLGIGTPLTRMIAGLAYALSPHVLSVLGPVSAEALPMCLTPWVIVPLVDGVRGGSARRAGLRSGLAVLAMGAINAALVVAALLPAALFLLTRRWDAQVRRVAGAWVLGVVLATSWWVVPLLLLGRYGVPFLGHIEPAATTTGTTTLVETVRGTSDWVPYLSVAHWNAGALFLTSGTLVLETVAVAAIGLAGLAQRRMPYRGFLITSLLVGLVVICAGHVGALDGVAAPEIRHLLDGALAPLRNVHKFDVALRLPLVLGLAHAAARFGWGRTPAERRLSRPIAMVLVAAAVAGTATPLLALRLTPNGSFAAVPSYWRQAANYLADRHASGRALLLPGSQFGQYIWGDPQDEPMQALARSAWDVRGAVPLVNAGHVRLLDGLDQGLNTGTPMLGLSAYLARSGVSYLVVRNDLDQVGLQVPRPVQVYSALAGSPGLSLVQAFGPPIGQDVQVAAVFDQYLQLPRRAVEIWAVAGPRERRVAAVAQSDTTQLSGGPEQLLENGAASAGGAAVLTGDRPNGYGAGSVVLSDGLRRREVNYGSGSSDTSATLTRDDPRRLNGVDRDWLPFPGEDHQTRAAYDGARAIRASSSASDANVLGSSVHAEAPYAAFDDDQQTAWRANPATFGVGEWLQIDFAAPQGLAGATLRMAAGSTATQVRVTTSAGSLVMSLAPTRADGSTPIQRLRAAPGRTSFLRLTVTRVAGGKGFRPVGVADVSIPGFRVRRTMVMPDDLARGTTVDAVQMSATADGRPGCIIVSPRPRCAAGLARLGEETSGLDRTFNLPSAATYDLTASATPRSGPGLDELLRQQVQPAVSLTASSQAVDDPLASAQSAYDDDLTTGWIAPADDPAPQLRLSWQGARRISSLRITTAAGLAATPPDHVLVLGPGVRSEELVAPDGSVTFPPMVTDHITLTLQSVLGLRSNVDLTGTGRQRLGLGISELTVPGLSPTGRAATDAQAVELPCGAGPTVTVDGRRRLTSVTTTVAALRELRPVRLTVCGNSTVVLDGGRHRAIMDSSDTWLATTVELQRSGVTVSSASGSAGVTVRGWGDAKRQVAVEARTSPMLLVVRENANAGWSASMDGRTLRRVTVDGWQQGYLLPRGSAGVVTLRYDPDRYYRLALFLGALLVLLLLVGALLRPRRHGGQATGAHSVESTLPAGQRWLVVALLNAAVLLVAVLLGGAVGAVLWAVAVGVRAAVDAAARRRPAPSHLVPWIAAGGYLVAGAVLSVRHWETTDYAGDWPSVQALTLFAVLVTAWVPWPSRRSARHPAAH